ncbi:hypothetical protein [Mycobacterium sp. SMC-17]|uniref:hypothetical protein n=1 Tax=Mycobacterium sp. SMC-17 TaxID=3381628 RepID=UPI003876F7FC
MTRTIAQHLANNPGIAQHVASNLGGDAPMRLHHRVHTLQHGAHGGWLTAIIALLIIGLPFIIALAGIIYRGTRRGSTHASTAYRPVTVAPWQSGTTTPAAAPWQSGTTTPAAAPWQSGMVSSTSQPYTPPTAAPAPVTPPAPAVPAWSAPPVYQGAAPAPQWTH